MSTLRKYAFPLVIALQVIAVLGFAGVREMTLRTGQEVVLQTVPVDPRDLFRGDYVALRYTISTVDNCYIREIGSDIYVNLERRGDVWQADGYEYDAPEYGTFIHGKVTGKLSGDRCRVDYGIESYFVPEGSGKAIERAETPVKVKVSVDSFGTAAIKEIVFDAAGAARPADRRASVLDRADLNRPAATPSDNRTSPKSSPSARVPAISPSLAPLTLDAPRQPSSGKRAATASPDLAVMMMRASITSAPPAISDPYDGGPAALAKDAQAAAR